MSVNYKVVEPDRLCVISDWIDAFSNDIHLFQEIKFKKWRVKLKRLDHQWVFVSRFAIDFLNSVIAIAKCFEMNVQDSAYM